ncbi:MAG: orotate phosphoribosyltransferase [Thermodesulfobacteriota bacterium]
MDDATRRLAEMLLERSFLENHDKPFLLASGKTSPFYFECSLTTTWPPAMPLIGKLVFERIRGKVKAVGGPTMGADPISAAVAYYSATVGEPIPWFSIRKTAKDHGTGGLLEGSAPAPGEPVALVDDVLTRGGAMLDGLRAARESGLAVAVAVVLLDREEQDGRARVEAACREVGAEFVALLSKSDVDAVRAARDAAAPGRPR